ncbi:hypothetical protein EXIGLDRAFT_753925 [Exidia glandulosa HHB12029]|uniref:Uncharacterized protein n=1 Tax=Exidia glandulosa HHB12029 TaxID=1314781 RepID=A0A165DE71_EXIGL|nr:hypothetical protein EXIGLDRAFT_753925 [Exidia glandulosa HHB12029]
MPMRVVLNRTTTPVYYYYYYNVPFDANALTWPGVRNAGETINFRSRVYLLQCSVAVTNVDSLKATYTVRDAPDIQPVVNNLSCFLADAACGNFTLFRVSSSTNVVIAREMTKRLGLRPDHHVSLVKEILFNDDEEEVLETLHEAGIGFCDRSTISRFLRFLWAHTAQQSSLPSRSASTVDALSAYLETKTGRAEIARVESVAAKVNLPTAKDFASSHSLARSTAGGARASGNDEDVDGDDGSDSDVTAASPTLGFPSMHTGLDEELIIIGFLGEKFVYTLLKSILPEGTFTHDNWRSVLRERAGFTPFLGQEFEDFRYLDTEGALTKRLFPPSHRYHNARPEYFIEVKTTTHGPNEFFYMKRSQLQQARPMLLKAFEMSQHANPTTAGSVERLYLIFRVSNIRDERPVLTVYDDPHHLLCRGLLRIESDSVVVRVPSGQHSVDHNLA